MKILVQNPYMKAGGAESRIRTLLQSLVRRPDIDQVHFMFKGDQPIHQVEADGKFHYWQIRPKTTKEMTKKVIKDFDIDIVQLHNNQFIGTGGIEYAQKLGIPTVWIMHDFWPLCSQRFMTKVWAADSSELCYDLNMSKCQKCVGNYQTLLTKRQRDIINKCDVGIVPSENIKSIFERNDVLKGKLKIIKPWIDLGIFAPDPSINRKPFQILFASGNYIPHKGINVLLKAWEYVQRRLPQANLIAIGDQRCANETISKAKQLQLQNVNFLNRVEQSQLKRFYNESALTIFPSIWEETIGLVWIESLACGTPVICSDTGSMKELLLFGGEMFEPRNHVALAEKIVDLLLSPSKRNIYAQQGHKYVTTSFQPTRAANDFAHLYYKLEVEKIDKDNKSGIKKEN